jgi:hypothetical protein
VIENKRNRTPREVLAQTIDSAAWVSTLTFDEGRGDLRQVPGGER